MNILVVTYARFPEGDAEAIRLHSIGKVLREIGHEVTYVGMGFSEYLEKNEFDGFGYVSLRKKSKNKLDRIYYYINYKKRLKAYISSYLNMNKTDTIFFADVSPVTIAMLKKICKKESIQLVADSVEWYSPEQFKWGSLSPFMIFKNIENKDTIDRSIKVIAISKYLKNHFTDKGCMCVRIPVILDVKNMSCRKNTNPETLTLLYAGSPGKKDYIYEMLRGVLLLDDKNLDKLRFILAGVGLEDVKSLFKPEELTKLESCVEFLGRVDRKLVLKKLEETDFTVLLRSSEQRYAKAGFPTKVVESLATATPVILNVTSDLGDYIRDSENGIVVEKCTAEAFSIAVKRALKLTYEQRKKMYEGARKCAEENFDYKLYKEHIERIL